MHEEIEQQCAKSHEGTHKIWSFSGAKTVPFHPRWNSPQGSEPPFCSFKARGLENNLQNGWVPMIFFRYEMVGLCASTRSFHHPSILYGGILSPDVRFRFFPEYEFCLHAWTFQKKAPFCKNLFLCIFPAFFSIVIIGATHPFCKEMGSMMQLACRFAMLKRIEAFISLLLLPKRWVVLESRADRDKWQCAEFWDLNSCNSAACFHQEMKLLRSHFLQGCSFRPNLQNDGVNTLSSHLSLIDVLSLPAFSDPGSL